MNSKPVVLIVYDYFYPGYKAGGPVQSLTNLVVALQNEYSFAVLTTGYDLMSKVSYQNILLDHWNSISIPDVEDPVKIWYADNGKPGIKTLKEIIREIRPDVIYLNGIYSFRLFVLPLFVKRFFPAIKLIVCPRGMLQSGALSVKSSKKKYFIGALKLSGVLNFVQWHATTPEEAADIKVHFPKNEQITVAANIPKAPYISVLPLPKKEGMLKIVYLSLITQKKNLHLLLQIMQTLPAAVTLDIYGPVKDERYWKECLEYINKNPTQVLYKGDVKPIQVQQVLADYHVMALLTKGENFGHAIYESLSVGRPVITSYYTPWQNLWEQKAGANADIDNIEACKHAINRFVSMNQEDYNSFCEGAIRLCNSYYKNVKATESYQVLFG